MWIGKESHNFAPFVDTDLHCDARARYKASGRSEGGLIAFQSPNGILWRRIQEKPVITEGAFDSLNIAFWDETLGKYREYHRGFRDGYRDMMTCESDDFLHWTKPRWLDWSDAPREHLYTNAIRPYFLNPRILLGFPVRFVPDRAKVPEDPYPALCDNVLIVSRDGLHFTR